MGMGYYQGSFVEENKEFGLHAASRACTTQILAMEQLVKAYRLLGNEEMAKEWESKLKNAKDDV